MARTIGYGHGIDERGNVVRFAAWRDLPREERAAFVHPASSQKPAGWTLERFLTARRRRDDAS